jgi:endoglycosylceramidase
VNFSADNGIYPLIDMHQDVWNRKFCGEGVPDWAAQNNFNFSKSMQFPWPLSKPYEVDENNYPSEEECVSRKWP